MDYRSYFKGKKVTVLGLGLLGKRLGDVQFLSKMGAFVTVTDLKTAVELKPSVDALKNYKNITFVLGEHRFEDFEKKDLILKGQGVLLDSPYIAHARKQKIPIEMDESLFMKLAPDVMLVGVTGTRGKTFTTELIYHILRTAKKPVHLGGNIKGTAALPLLEKVKAGDIVVFELSSWQLQGFEESKIAPHVAVFTNFMPDHLNYYKGDVKQYFKDKAAIFKYQTKQDILIVGANVAPQIRGKAKGRFNVARATDIPDDWQLQTPGEHNRENAACAIAAARSIGIDDATIKKAVLSFPGVPGRLELVREYKGIAIYNDTCACTPEATVAGLNALHAPKGNLILIAGGTDKMINPTPLAEAIPLYAKTTILLPGSGTLKLKAESKQLKAVEVKSLKDAVKEALSAAKKGDTILFSPGFSSFEMFKNEYDRGEQFVKIIQALK